MTATTIRSWGFCRECASVVSQIAGLQVSGLVTMCKAVVYTGRSLLCAASLRMCVLEYI